MNHEFLGVSGDLVIELGKSQNFVLNKEFFIFCACLLIFLKKF